MVKLHTSLAFIQQKKGRNSFCPVKEQAGQFADLDLFLVSQGGIHLKKHSSVVLDIWLGLFMSEFDT